MAAAPADTTSPASPAASPAISSRRTPRRGPQARASRLGPGDQPEEPGEGALDGAMANGGAAGGLPDSGLLSPSSSRVVTTESYGLSGRSGPASAGLAPARARPRRVLVSRTAVRDRSG